MSLRSLVSLFAIAAASAALPTLSHAQVSSADNAAPAAEASGAVTLQPELTNPADVDRAIRAAYPDVLRDAGVEGTVTVRLRVAADGKVDRNSITVVNASHELFAEPAQHAAARMRFRPAERNGTPVATEITVPVEFHLQ